MIFLTVLVLSIIFIALPTLVLSVLIPPLAPAFETVGAFIIGFLAWLADFLDKCVTILLLLALIVALILGIISLFQGDFSVFETVLGYLLFI